MDDSGVEPKNEPLDSSSLSSEPGCCTTTGGDTLDDDTSVTHHTAQTDNRHFAPQSLSDVTGLYRGMTSSSSLCGSDVKLLQDGSNGMMNGSHVYQDLNRVDDFSRSYAAQLQMYHNYSGGSSGMFYNSLKHCSAGGVGGGGGGGGNGGGMGQTR